MTSIVPFVCQAQVAAPSQVTPESLRPSAGPRDRQVILPGETPALAPAGGEDLTVTIGEIRIEGAFPELEQAIRRLIENMKEKKIKVSQIYELARVMERIHNDAGYPLARVVVPPQKLVDNGPLVYLVVDGFIEDIDTSGIPERVRSVVYERTRSLIGRRHVRLNEIERALLTAGDIPGLRLRSALAPGQTTGGTRLVLEGTHQLITGSIGGDDRLAASLGTWQLRGTVAANSTFGAGEQIYGTAGLSAKLGAAFAGSAPLGVYGGGAIIPLNEAGFTLNPEYTHSTTRTAALPGVPATMGTFERVALRLRDPIDRTRSSSLFLNASLEYISQQVGAPAFGVLLSNDRYAVARMGPEYSVSLPWQASLQMSGSLSGGLGGRTDLDALMSHVPLSRLGSTPDFAKVNGSVTISQSLPNDLRLDLIGLGQLSMGQPMMLSEQFALDGSNAVSGFAAGTINVDQGATLRAELVRPLSITASGVDTTVAPYLFAAAGYGELFQPTAVEQSIVNAGALGLGMRGSIPAGSGTPGVSVGLELARRFSDIPNMRQGWRGNAIASMEF